MAKAGVAIHVVGQRNVMRVFTERGRPKIRPSLRLGSGHDLFDRRSEDHSSDAKGRKSLRETLNPLKTLKTAKSGDFSMQGNQRLSKSRDFAGETISLRFPFIFVSREILSPKKPQWGKAQKFGKPPIAK